MVRIAFDIGGVLGKYPEIFRVMIEALLAHPDVEVHVLTDVPPPRAIRLVHVNGFVIPAERIHSCDVARHGDDCKAVKIAELGIDVLIDDHLPYLRNVNALRLHVQPDKDRPFFHPTFDECRGP